MGNSVSGLVCFGPPRPGRAKAAQFVGLAFDDPEVLVEEADDPVAGVEFGQADRLAVQAFGDEDLTAERTLQLVDARDGGPRPASDVLATRHLQATAAINTTLDGKTQRQKNPHPPNSLAWIAARLGGWNCYYKPPGPKTMRRGWERLEDRLQGYMTAAHAT